MPQRKKKTDDPSRPKERQRRGPRGEGGFYQRRRKIPGTDPVEYEYLEWIGTYVWEDEYGEKHRAAVTSMDKVIAKQKHRKLKADIDTGTYKPRSGMTVEKWMTYWLEEIVKPNKAPKTYKSYRDTVKNHIIPHVGSKPLPVSPAIIRGNLKKIAETTNKPRNAELAYAVWSVAMKAAKKEEVIKTDPTEAVTKPMNNESGGKALTTDQARRVLLSAQKAKDPMVTRWAAALLLGARQGELLGLERDRVDVDKMTVELSWQLQSLPLKPGASMDDPDRFDVPDGLEVRPLYKQYAFTRPKTDRSKRLTPLPAPLAAILKVHLQMSARNRFGLVWVSKTGLPISNSVDNKGWHAALTRAKVPDVPLHDARHTTATLLQEMGVEESVRMQIMGHSTVAAARRYTHVDLSHARKALGNLDVLLATEAEGKS